MAAELRGTNASDFLAVSTLCLPPPLLPAALVEELDAAFANISRSQSTKFHYCFLGSLCPFAAKALPKLVSDPPPAGLAWHRPQANFVCAA